MNEIWVLKKSCKESFVKNLVLQLKNYRKLDRKLDRKLFNYYVKIMYSYYCIFSGKIIVLWYKFLGLYKKFFVLYIKIKPETK